MDGCRIAVTWAIHVGAVLYGIDVPGICLRGDDGMAGATNLP
jgi:hypothetical protein